MSNRFNKIFKYKSETFKRLFGISKRNFKFLLKLLIKGLEDRQITKGRKHILPPIGMLSIALRYLKSYETFLSLSYRYKISESTACRIQKLVEDILIKSELITVNRKEELQTSQVIIIDATEIIIHRPKKNQKHWYSGKKKKHTAKFQIIISKTGKILQTNFRQGSVHDFKLL